MAGDGGLSTRVLDDLADLLDLNILVDHGKDLGGKSREGKGRK